MSPFEWQYCSCCGKLLAEHKRPCTAEDVDKQTEKIKRMMYEYQQKVKR